MDINQIIIIVVTLVLIPLLAPFLQDCLANIFIACMNRMKSKPTFKVGVEFNFITFPNGERVSNTAIHKTDFSTVYFGEFRGDNTLYGLIPVKKRAMRGLVMSVRIG